MKRRAWRSRAAEEKGFTLVELLVVMSILAVLAAVVIPTVTGVNTVARNTAQPADMQQVQTAVNRFNADDTDGSPWPTSASGAGATSSWSAGALPGTAPTASGTAYTFTLNSIAGINFDSSATVNGSAKTLAPDYLAKPKYSTTSIILDGTTTTRSYTVTRASVDYTVVLSRTTSGTETYSAWGVDRNGQAWVFVTKDAY